MAINSKTKKTKSKATKAAETVVSLNDVVEPETTDEGEKETPEVQHIDKDDGELTQPVGITDKDVEPTEEQKGEDELQLTAMNQEERLRKLKARELNRMYDTTFNTNVASRMTQAQKIQELLAVQ